ncbi:hypothetical protein QL285_082650 [Trifolium repens]|nr:hypothetical protein QL285_082650 [Trifolium repens]
MRSIVATMTPIVPRWELLSAQGMKQIFCFFEANLAPLSGSTVARWERSPLRKTIDRALLLHIIHSEVEKPKVLTIAKGGGASRAKELSTGRTFPLQREM